MSTSPRCPSVHIWSGQRCIRPNGHDGYCCGKIQRGARGKCERAYWGKFKSHWYETTCPKNTAGVKQ